MDPDQKIVLYEAVLNAIAAWPESLADAEEPRAASAARLALVRAQAVSRPPAADAIVARDAALGAGQAPPASDPVPAIAGASLAVEAHRASNGNDDVHDVVGVCKRIAAHLRARSGKPWSVTRDRGTAAGWITIASPPRRRSASGVMTEADRQELTELLGLSQLVDDRGESVAASADHRREYLARAEFGSSWMKGKIYWD